MCQATASREDLRCIPSNLRSLPYVIMRCVCVDHIRIVFIDNIVCVNT